MQYFKQQLNKSEFWRKLMKLFTGYGTCPRGPQDLGCDSLLLWHVVQFASVMIKGTVAMGRMLLYSQLLPLMSKTQNRREMPPRDYRMESNLLVSIIESRMSFCIL